MDKLSLIKSSSSMVGTSLADVLEPSELRLFVILTINGVITRGILIRLI